MKPKVCIPVETLRQFLAYDEQTGAITWIVRPTPNSHRRAGDIAGCARTAKGDAVIKIPGFPLAAAHRVAWAIAKGAWPELLIDHINGDPSDNRLCNLREANHRINSENRRRPISRAGSTGQLGVVFHKGAFQAQIRSRGKYKYLGRFSTAEQAHAAYLSAKRQLHEGNTL